jgi:hypothetical protein
VVDLIHTHPSQQCTVINTVQPGPTMCNADGSSHRRTTVISVVSYCSCYTARQRHISPRTWNIANRQRYRYTDNNAYLVITTVRRHLIGSLCLVHTHGIEMIVDVWRVRDCRSFYRRRDIL